MASVNKVILIGNLGADPELRYTPAGRAVTNFRIATSNQWTTKDGDKKEGAEWHRVVTWDKLAEFCGEHLKKGSSVYLEGRLQTRSWEDQSGTKKWSTEVVANHLLLLGARQSGESSKEQTTSPPEDLPSNFDADDDLPF